MAIDMAAYGKKSKNSSGGSGSGGSSGSEGGDKNGGGSTGGSTGDEGGDKGPSTPSEPAIPPEPAPNPNPNPDQQQPNQYGTTGPCNPGTDAKCAASQPVQPQPIKCPQGKECVPGPDCPENQACIPEQCPSGFEFGANGCTRDIVQEPTPTPTPGIPGITPTPTPTPTPQPTPTPIIQNTAIAISIVVNQIKNIFKSHTTVNNIVPTQVPQTFFLKNQTVPLHLCNGVAPGPCYDIVHQSIIIP